MNDLSRMFRDMLAADQAWEQLLAEVALLALEALERAARQ
jgi:hypothetical protein